jgi:DnaK suppressor protein
MSQLSTESIVARLRTELDRAKEELAEVAAEAARPPEAELGGGSEGYATWQTSVVLRQHIEKRIEELEDALARAEKGLYGVCEDCGNPIGVERLEALPFTVFCIDCAPRHHHY